jgi:hypothetical protein
MVGVPVADWSPGHTATGDGSHRNIILFPPEMDVRLSPWLCIIYQKEFIFY